MKNVDKYNAGIYTVNNKKYLVGVFERGNYKYGNRKKSSFNRGHDMRQLSE